jgi:hypothetical protein
MGKQKLLRLVPFFILFIILIFAWKEMLTVTHVARIRHLIAASLFVINIVLYFFSFRYGTLLTGIILFLATFNLAAITCTIWAKAYFIIIAGLEISTPYIQPWSLLVLIVFLVINLKYLINSFKRQTHAV